MTGTSMKNTNAVILFSKAFSINVHQHQEHPLQFQYEDLHALQSAVLEDVVEKISQLTDTDIFVFNDEESTLDTTINKWFQRVLFRQIQGTTFSEQVQNAVVQVMSEEYLHLVVVFENHPIISVELLQNVFQQLICNEDCVVVGPTTGGTHFLIGVRSDQREFISSIDGDTLLNHNLLLERLCESPVILVLTRTLYALDSVSNLVRLRNELSMGQGIRPKNYRKTLSVLRMLEKKYKFNRVA